MNDDSSDPSLSLPLKDRKKTFEYWRKRSLINTGLLASLVLLTLMVLFGTPHGPTYLPEMVLNILAVIWAVVVLTLNLSAMTSAARAIKYARQKPSSDYVFATLLMMFHAGLLIFFGPFCLYILAIAILALSGEKPAFR